MEKLLERLWHQTIRTYAGTNLKGNLHQNIYLKTGLLPLSRFRFINDIFLYGHLTNRRSRRRCSVKKVLFEISKNSQEINCDRYYFLIKFQVLGLQLYQKAVSGTGAFL